MYTREKIKLCYRCGKPNHTFKVCTNPITSFGVICFRLHKNMYHKNINQNFLKEHKNKSMHLLFDNSENNMSTDYFIHDTNF